MIQFGKIFIKFCKSFIKFNKARQYTDMQLGQGQKVCMQAIMRSSFVKKCAPRVSSTSQSSCGSGSIDCCVIALSQLQSQQKRNVPFGFRQTRQRWRARHTTAQSIPLVEQKGHLLEALVELALQVTRAALAASAALDAYPCRCEARTPGRCPEARRVRKNVDAWNQKYTLKMNLLFKSTPDSCFVLSSFKLGLINGIQFLVICSSSVSFVSQNRSRTFPAPIFQRAVQSSSRLCSSLQ